MSISNDQKVDYLWKKVGYGAAKRDINSVLNATQEGIPSPLLLRGDNVWAKSGDIPGTIPASSSGVVTVYPTTNPIEISSFDASARDNRFWNTGQIDWIPPELGSTYVVKVYIHTSGDAANAASNGTQLFATGSGNNDEWFFDYQAGTLNFIGDNLPNGVNFTGKSVYISGARYIGPKGVTIVGAAGSFSNLYVTGLSTFASNVDINADLDIDGHTELDNVNVSGVSTFVGVGTFQNDLYVAGNLYVLNDVSFDDINGENINITGIATIGSILDLNGTLNVSGVSTFTDSTDNTLGDSNTGAVQIDGGLGVDKNVTIGGNLDVQGYSNFVGVVTFRGGTINIGDANTDDVNIGGEFVSDLVPDETNLYNLGSDSKQWKNLYIDGTADVDALTVSGVSTFTDTIDANGDLDVDGVTELDITNISETLNVTGVSTFSSNVDINADIDIDGHTELDNVNISGIVTTFELDVDGHTELDNVNISGVTTFAGNIDANGDLDVDGVTELDITNISETLNVTGIATFTSNIDANGDLDVDGFTELDSTNISETLNVVGLTTLGSNVDINADLDVDGRTELDTTNISETLNVVGLTTLGSNVDINADVDISGNLTVHTDLDVDGHTELDDVNVSGVITATSFHTGVEGSSIRINSASITGPSTITIDPSGIGDNTGLLIIKGDLQVDGTQTIINSTIVEVDDLNIMLADGAVNDAAADGGGITVQSGEGNKTFQFESTGDNFGSSENINLATGKTYKIANTEVLSSTQLTVANINSSGIGTIETLDATTGTIDYLSVTNINVSGLSTFTNAVDINADLDVDGFTELDSTNISETLNVVGLTTLGSNVDVNASVDISGELVVDGLTDLDELNVAGLSTFASNVDINASVDISNHLTVDGTTDLDELNVTGISTFSSDIDINASIDVDGHTELDNVNISGVSTFVGVSTFQANLFVDGTINSTTAVNVNGVSVIQSAVDEALALAIALG